MQAELQTSLNFSHSVPAGRPRHAFFFLQRIRVTGRREPNHSAHESSPSLSSDHGEGSAYGGCKRSDSDPVHCIGNRLGFVRKTAGIRELAVSQAGAEDGGGIELNPAVKGMDEMSAALTHDENRKGRTGERNAKTRSMSRCPMPA